MANLVFACSARPASAAAGFFVPAEIANMGRILIPGQPEAEPAAEPWPVDEHTIRIDEMFARQLDNEFSASVRGLLHDPETGIAAQRGEAALEAIAGAVPALNDLKERTLAQAIGPRQRSILEPLVETRLDWAAGTLGQLAQRATVEVDDATVADRLAGLNQDAATSWHDSAYLTRRGRTAVGELRYQGERRGWDPTETDARVRAGLSDLYVGAVETAIGQDDLDGATGLYDHARPVIDPERQTAIDRRFVQAREAAVYRDVDRDMVGIPIEPAGPPGTEVFQERAAELTPKDASDEVRARIGQITAFAQRRAGRQWQKQQAEAGVAALDWFAKNPGRSFLAIPPDIRDWLAPDQWRGLEALFIEGRLRTDRDLFERLDRLLVYEPDRFAALDLDRHRLSLDDEDHARFTGAQKAIVEGTSSPAFARYRWTRLGIDRALGARGIDTDGPEAVEARAGARDQLHSFETIEGRAPNGEDIDRIIAEEIEGIRPDVSSVPTAEPDTQAETSQYLPSTDEAIFDDTGEGPPGEHAGDPNILQANSGNTPSRRVTGRREPTATEETRQSIYNTHREALERLEPNNPALTTLSAPGRAPDREATLRLRQELLEARARAAGGTLPSPVGSGATSSGGRELPGGGRLERPLGIPKDWRVILSRKNGGVTYVNPNNEHDHIRIMPGELPWQEVIDHPGWIEVREAAKKFLTLLKPEA
jgi:hypothetical protein